MTRKCHVRFGGGPSEKYPLRQLAGGLPNDPILIEGRLQFRQWENQEGERRSKVDVVVDSFQFLPRSGSSESYGEDGDSNDDQRAGARSGAGGQGEGKTPADFDEGEWEDIPFHHRSARRSIVADIL